MIMLFPIMFKTTHDKEVLSQYNIEMTSSSDLLQQEKKIAEVDTISLPF